MERVEKAVKCWEVMECDKERCPVYRQLQTEPMQLIEITSNVKELSGLIGVPYQ